MPERLQELIDTMVEREILYEADGLLSLGQRGEKLYGRKNFFELYAVFTSPPVMRVQHGKEDVGYIQALFVSMHDRNKGPLCFRLSGRAWEVGQIDWSKGVLHVGPAEHGRVPSWLGLPGRCQRAVPGHDGRTPPGRAGGGWLTRTAALELASMREATAGCLNEGTAPLEDQPDGVVWHTFAGGAVNRLLAAGLERRRARSGSPATCLCAARTAGDGRQGRRSRACRSGLGASRVRCRAGHGARHGEQVPAVPAGGR